MKLFRSQQKQNLCEKERKREIEMWNSIERVAIRTILNVKNSVWAITITEEQTDKWLFLPLVYLQLKEIRRVATLIFSLIVKFLLPLERLAKFLCIPSTNKPKLKQLNTHTGITLDALRVQYCD